MALTIQYCSDLHLEMDLNRKWINKYPLAVKGDVLLLGGDIMLFAQMEQHNDFLDYVAANNEVTYWIPGNHENYNSDINYRSGVLQETVRNNVFILNNATINIGGFCSNEWQLTIDKLIRR
jgi:predicted phosphohydrolase